MICSSQTVLLVSHCFTTRSSRTGRGLVYTPQVPLMICSSQTVRLVSHCFTTRTSRTSRTSRAKRNMPLYGSYQFVYIGQPFRPTIVVDEKMLECFSALPTKVYPQEGHVRVPSQSRIKAEASRVCL